MEHENKTEHHHKDVNIDNDKVWAVAGYIFFAIPLIFVKEKSVFLKYHINQSLILFIFSIVGQIVVKAVLFNGFIFNYLFNIFCLVLFVIGIMNVINKHQKPLPVIGEWFSFLK